MGKKEEARREATAGHPRCTIPAGGTWPTLDSLETNLLSTLLGPAAGLWPTSFLSVPLLKTSSDLLVINPCFTLLNLPIRASQEQKVFPLTSLPKRTAFCTVPVFGMPVWHSSAPSGQPGTHQNRSLTYSGMGKVRPDMITEDLTIPPDAQKGASYNNDRAGFKPSTDFFIN